jgi:phenylalanyl-tRNA synthetase beta subunit
MKVSYNWLKDFFDTPLPTPEVIQDLLTMHSFEVESLVPHGSDFILDIKVLPDRAHDCLSHWGIAKEVSALTGITLRSDLFHNVDLQFTDKVFTGIEDAKDTMRFLAVHIRNVEVRESPEWLKTALESVGQKSINNIVDATNYIMLAYGQPMHAYDTGKLESEDGHYFLVSERAGKVEQFSALDNKEYTIAPDMLVIRDGTSKKTLGIAGIKGGNASKIDSDTRNIILEAANFNASLIRKTSQRLKLRTDASERFEKEIIPELALRAMKEVIDLILDISGPNTLVDGISDAYPKRRNYYRLGLGLRDVELKLGIKISEKDLYEILERLGCEIRRAETKDVVTLAEAVLGAPYKLGSSISFDAPNAFDCSSLTAYLFSQIGYSIPRISVDQFFFAKKIVEGNLLPGDFVFLNSHTGRIHHKSIEFMPGAEVTAGVDHVALYVGNGEVIHASPRKGYVVREKIIENENIKNNIVGFGRVIFEDVRYVVTVPLERLDLMSKRAFLVSGNTEDLIEEIGRVYGYVNIPSTSLPATSFKPAINKTYYYTEKIRQALVGEGFSEVMTYAFTHTGEVEVENPLGQDKKFLRKSLMPALETALKANLVNAELLGLERIKLFEMGKVFEQDREILMLGIAVENAKKMKETPATYIQTIISTLSDTLGVYVPEPRVSETQRVVEINIHELIKKLPDPTEYEFEEKKSVITYSPISPYPYIVRDLALFVPEGVAPETVEALTAPFLTNLCVRSTLFDSFLKTLPDGTKKQSYAWRFIFQSFERTLTDEEVNKIMEGVYSAVKENGFEVR